MLIPAGETHHSSGYEVLGFLLDTVVLCIDRIIVFQIHNHLVAYWPSLPHNSHSVPAVAFLLVKFP